MATAMGAVIHRAMVATASGEKLLKMAPPFEQLDPTTIFSLFDVNSD